MRYNKSKMNWFEWSFGDEGWTVPFWFLPLMFLYVVQNSWKNSAETKTAENKSKASEESMAKKNVVYETPIVYNEDETAFEYKCAILAEVWLQCRDDEEFVEFISYNDLGLPLAYAIANDVVVETDAARAFIEEAFSLLLTGYNIEDTGFESFDDILEVVDGSLFGSVFVEEQAAVLYEQENKDEGEEVERPQVKKTDKKF